MAKPNRKKNQPAGYRVRFEDFEGEDIREFYDSNCLRVWHLDGKDRIFRIAHVQRAVAEEGGEVERKAALWLENGQGQRIDLPFIANPTNRDTIRSIHGNKPKAWIGKLIQLYPTTCEAWGEVKDCIRVRPFDPATRQTRKQTRQAAPQQRAPELPPAERRPEIIQTTGIEFGDFPESKPAPDDDEPIFVRNEYVDATADDSEPPPGALATDIIR